MTDEEKTETPRAARSEESAAKKPAAKPAAKAKAADKPAPTKPARTAKAKDEAASAAAAATTEAKSADEPAKKPARAAKAKPAEKATTAKADKGAGAESAAAAPGAAARADDAGSASAPKGKRSTKPESPAELKVVRAQAKYVRSSARKARLVCDNIRGKSVTDARAILAHTPRAIARDWSKLLESAVANAEHNHELVGEDLVIKAVTADEGPTIKRFRPRARGRATSIRKRTSHLTILLTPKN